MIERVIGWFLGKRALAACHSKLSIQQYYEGRWDGSMGIQPLEDSEHYMDGWLDAYEGRRPLPPIRLAARLRRS